MHGDTRVEIDLAGSDIHGEAERIRRHGAIAEVELPGGHRLWSVTGYQLARQLLADDRFSKDAGKHWPAYRNGQIGPDFPLIAWARMDNFSTSYGKEHSRERRQILKAFTLGRVTGMRAGIERLVTELLDELAGRPAGTPIDLKAEFAHPLAARVIGDLIGVPPADRPAILGGGYGTANTLGTPDQVAAAFALRTSTIQQLIETKKQSPGDDLVSDLLASSDQGGMTDAQIVATVLLLLNTGTEPAMNLIINACWALLTHPDQLGMVHAGTISWTNVIEETLRVEAPVAQLPFRFALQEVEIDGITIPAGEPIMMHFAAIGRDPEIHGEDAARFDATRADKRHLSFGHGSYRCLGSSLAWLELEVGLSALFNRFDQLSLAVPEDQLAPDGTFMMNGRRALPVYLRPVAGPSRA